MAKLPEAIDELGVKLDATVDSNGWFHTAFDGEHLGAGTLVELRGKVRELLKQRARGAAIPATVFYSGESWHSTQKSPPRFDDVDVTGIDRRGRGRLLMRKDGRAYSSEYGTATFRRLSDEERARYLELRAEEAAAAQAVKTWELQYKLDVTDVEAAIASTMTGGKEDQK